MVFQQSAQKELERLRKKDRQAYIRIRGLLAEVSQGRGKILNNKATEVHGCRSLRSGKLRVIYRPGPDPEVLYVGYRREVYHGNCNN